MTEQPYLDMTDPANGEVIARVYASRIVFVRARDYEELLRIEGAERVPEGVSFPIGEGALVAAEKIKTPDAVPVLEIPATDPPWLAAMRIAEPRPCDSCGSPDGRYSAGRPGHYTACRACATAGLCMTCGEALVDGKCPGDPLGHETHEPRVLEKTSTYRGGAAYPDTVRHVRDRHPSLAAHLKAEPDVHDPSVPIGDLTKLSQTYLSDMHESAHDSVIRRKVPKRSDRS